jgi:hypothetical protein
MRALPLIGAKHTPNRTSPFSIRLARKLVFAIDSIQRRRHHVYEFDPDPNCILRLSQGRSLEDRTLSDGTVVRRGDPILEIHFWNEHIPLMGRSGADLGWGLEFYSCARRSLQSLALHIACRPELEEFVAVCGETSLAASVGWRRYGEFLHRFGFDFIPVPTTASTNRRACFWESLHVWIIIWVLNPNSLKGRSLITAERCEMWISRSELLRRYGLPTTQSARAASGLKPSAPEIEVSAHRGRKERVETSRAAETDVARVPARHRSPLSAVPADTAAEPLRRSRQR